jgi:hypothetical protein
MINYSFAILRTLTQTLSQREREHGYFSNLLGLEHRPFAGPEASGLAIDRCGGQRGRRTARRMRALQKLLIRCPHAARAHR